MKSRRLPIYFHFAFILAAALACCESRAADAKNRHVVVICLDGFAAYLLDDPKAPLPTIRRLAKEGAVAVGGMKVSNPSVTWPNHTSLVTGVRPEIHGVLANGVLVRGAADVPVVVDPKKDQRELVRVPTIADQVHAAGQTTAEVNWPCTRGSRAFDDSFPDTPDNVKYTTPRLRSELVDAGILVDDSDTAFKAGSVVGRDYIWTEAACHIIRKRKPNLLLVHLLNIDATHHSLGPQSAAGYTANAYADSCVARILQALDEAGIRQNTTVLLVADHGFTQTPKAICPNAVLRQEKLLTTDGAGKILEARINVVPEGGIGLVYCNNPDTAADDSARFQQLFSEREGVAEILSPDQFAAHGLPHPREYPQSPNLVIVAKDGFGVSGVADGETFVRANTEGRVSLGSHGFLSTSTKMNALCVLSGHNVSPAVRMNKVENIDIAPTIVHMLGVSPLSADGRILKEALNE